MYLSKYLYFVLMGFALLVPTEGPAYIMHTEPLRTRH